LRGDAHKAGRPEEAQVKGDRVAVAMSGGVDSTLSAWLLREAGYQVVGLSLRLGQGPDMGWRAGADAAAELGIPHHVVDVSGEFWRRVVEPAVATYAAGRTPNPCAWCNARVKLPLLWREARRLGCRGLATGHYVRLEDRAGRVVLAEARHRAKSQGYFLARVSPELLAVLAFPLGELSKEQVREMAARLGLSAAQRAESQDVCFLPAGGWDELVAAEGAVRPGEIRDQAGRVLARHQGLHRFTVGQRRGLGVAAGEPLYVVELDTARDRVVVGPREALARRDIRLRNVNWLGDAPLPSGEAALPVYVKIRSTRPAAPASVRRESDGSVHVRLEDPEYGVSRGQACVFYGAPGPGARILGGGVIDATK